MDEINSNQFAQAQSAHSDAASLNNTEVNASDTYHAMASDESDANQKFTNLNGDFLSLLTGVQICAIQKQLKQLEKSEQSNQSNQSNELVNKSALSVTSALSATVATKEESTKSSTNNKDDVEEKRKHHLWRRKNTNQERENTTVEEAPHFTPLPCAPAVEPFGIFDTRDGQVFDAATRLRLHTIIATCLMNGIADQRVNALIHLLQWPDTPKIIVIAGTYGAKITKDDGPTRKKDSPVIPDNTDTLRRNIWPQLGNCNAYDAIVERAQNSALQRINRSWQATNLFAGSTTGSAGREGSESSAGSANSSETFSSPSHIVLLAVRETPSEQSLEKLCQIFTASKKPVCISGIVQGVDRVSSALTATLSAIAVAPAVKHLPQIIHADDVLAERALIGDSTAVESLYNDVYQSLAPYNRDDPTLSTVDMFLRFGGALDQTAHELNVHPNTVRYRLRKVAQTTGWDATDPRAAYVLQTAITIGRIRDARSHIM